MKNILILFALFLHPASPVGLNLFGVQSPHQIFNSSWSALKRGVAYFEAHAEELNLDAVIGLRIVEGQIFELRKKLGSSTKEKAGRLRLIDLIDRLEKLETNLSNLSSRAITSVKTNETNYYKKLAPLLVEGFWGAESKWRDLDLRENSRWRTVGESYTEEESDGCLTQLIGTMNNTKCEPFADCDERMRVRGFSGYSLSHQAFYWFIGQRAGCFSQALYRSMTLKFCGDMLTENEIIEEDIYAGKNQDLFMENIALCGMMGFPEFLKRVWLLRMLDWQDASGCWKMWRLPSIRNDHTIGKRQEKVLEDGCRCHTTSVALCALAAYVRRSAEIIFL